MDTLDNFIGILISMFFPNYRQDELKQELMQCYLSQKMILDDFTLSKKCIKNPDESKNS